MKLSPGLIGLIKAGMETAKQAGNDDVTAMTLATASSCGRVSSRTLLLKGLDTEGLHFFTNLNSRKGRDLVANPQASITFYWPEIYQQIQIEGPVVQVATTEADRYFASRSRGSQIGAWASLQSEVLQSRGSLEQRVLEFKQKFANSEIPRPPHWTGFILQAQRVEFWQGREFRLHNRRVFTPGEVDWEEQSLYP